jgi:hypothetical protein
MKLEAEFITAQSLSAEQVAALEETTNAHEATLKQGWDGKANTDAEAIIDGAIVSVETLTGIKREQGVKAAEYFKLAGEGYSKGVKASYETKILELEEKMKTSPDEALRGELEDLKGKYDLLQQQEAEFKEWKEADYKTKYETTSGELSATKLRIAFNEVKPKFPDTVNDYESDAKWNKFVKDIQEKYNIDIDQDGKGIAIDKTNPHSIKKISELVANDKELSELAKGRSFKGLGNDKDPQKIDGVPFEIPKEATPSERTQAVRDYLTNELKLNKTSARYAEEFAKYNKLILEQKTA